VEISRRVERGLKRLKNLVRAARIRAARKHVGHRRFPGSFPTELQHGANAWWDREAKNGDVKSDANVKNSAAGGTQAATAWRINRLASNRMRVVTFR
jgi:hypothetical protein